MKRIIVLLMAAALLLSLCACGNEPAIGDNIPAAPEAEPSAPAAPETPEAPPEPTPEPGKKMELTFVTFNFDDKVWVYEEDDINDYESLTNIELWIPDPADPEEELVYIEFYINEESTLDFRSGLNYAQISVDDYAAGSLDTVTIGGRELLYYGDEDSITYLGRVENAGVTIEIDVYGDLSNEDLVSLVNSIEFTIPDTGNVEAPYAWEGEPYALPDAEYTIGAYTLKSHQLPIDECITTWETFNHNVAVVGSTAYIISSGVIRQYDFDGESFTFVGEVDAGEDFEYVDAAKDGSVWFSKFMRPLVNWKDGAAAASYEAPYQVAMHPGGAWGVSWFASNEVTMINIAGGAASQQEVILDAVKNISNVSVDAKGNIFVCGSAADDSGHKVFVYDKDFNLKTVLTDEDGTGMGSVTFAAETANGYIVMDGNMREIVLYDKAGTWIGSCDDGDLFGTDYPWFCDAQLMDDGSVICVMTDERPDGSSDELIAFRISGF